MDFTNKIYHDEDAARAHLEQIRWPEGVSCPHCGCVDKVKPTPMYRKPTKDDPERRELKGYYHCVPCLRKFTVRTGTIYASSPLPLHKWVYATHLLCSSKKGMSAHQLHRMLGITYKTAWFVFHRIREGMNDANPAPMGGGGGSVQADETYFGKKAVVTKRTKRGKPSHSSQLSVVALVSEGKARTFHVDRATVDSVGEILRNNVEKDSVLYTDESRLYPRNAAHFDGHETVKHTAGEYYRDGVTTNNCENYFSIFKRGMKGVYQHCNERHLQRYLSEFDFRYNTRDLTDAERSVLAIKGAEGKRLTYRA